MTGITCVGFTLTDRETDAVALLRELRIILTQESYGYTKVQEFFNKWEPPL